MNIDQAKAIPIAEIMKKLEMDPVKETKTDATYFSPFRNERTPSFHVNKQENVWYDHGEGIGGNAFDLVVKMLEARGFSFTAVDALRWFRNTNLDPALSQPRDRVKDKKSKWKLLDIMPLENLALFRYLRQRGINTAIAQNYIQEVAIKKIGTYPKIFALGFKNEEGGYEVRNRKFKSCISPKTITFIRADQPKPSGVMIFEGFMDCLTYLTIRKGEKPYDIIVLNTVACVDQAISYIKNYGYYHAYTWMDNDKAGDSATARLAEFIKSEPGLTHKPMNYLYRDHKDLNELHMHVLNLKPIS